MQARAPALHVMAYCALLIVGFASPLVNKAELVGWVERSDTHRMFAVMGIGLLASTHPTLETVTDRGEFTVVCLQQ